MTISSGAISETQRHVAGDEDHRAVFADRAGEGQREAGQQRRQRAPAGSTRAKVCSRRGAERRGGLLDLAVEVLQHRLHRAHDEGQADEDQRDDDAERRVGDLDAERRRAARRSSRSAHRARSARCRRPRSAARRAGRPGRRAGAARESGSAPAPRRRACPKTTLTQRGDERGAEAEPQRGERARRR